MHIFLFWIHRILAFIMLIILLLLVFRRSYLVPSTVAQGIKTIHPMFRGYTQQDTQEFLRCFMDQLHEELKTPFPDMNTPHQKEDPSPVPSLLGGGDSSNHSSACVPPESSESDESPAPSSSSDATIVNEESEYETCDSGLSSERSSVEQNLNQTLDDGNKGRWQEKRQESAKIIS